jgi:hypothetical protein
MRLIERTLDTGLIVQEYGMDYASIERALKRRDPLLSLQGWPSQAHGCLIWKVVRDAGSERPPDTVCVWQSDRGEPYPLSSGILDMVDRLDKNTRHEHVSEDELNARRAREAAKQADRDREALIDDHLFKHGIPVLPRSQSLRMARDKRRARGEKC